VDLRAIILAAGNSSWETTASASSKRTSIIVSTTIWGLVLVKNPSAHSSYMSHRPWIFCVWLGFMVTLCGCGGSGVVPVKGKVVFKGRELPEVCFLTFVPLDDSTAGGTIRPSTATMAPDGAYRVTPFLGVEGLLPGRYMVRVSYFDLKPGGNPDREADWIEQKFEADELLVESGSRSIEYNVEGP
jgi:hypothetical protein